MKKPTYLIFGATGGIGSALCRLLHTEGATLGLVGKHTDKLQALSAELGNAAYFRADITNPDAVADIFQQFMAQYQVLDGVANCVGSLLLKPAHLTTPEEWQKVIMNNLNTSFYITKYASLAMMKTGGSIVLTSSAITRYGFHNHEAISAAKAGVNGLVLSSAASYAKRNIRVNAVAPGLVRTPLTAHLTSSEVSEKASTAMHPLGRLGKPEDVAQAIRFFLDNRLSSWVTGQILAVDGGLSSIHPV